MTTLLVIPTKNINMKKSLQILALALILNLSASLSAQTTYNLDWGLNKQCDKKLIKKFIKELDKANEIVAHNGDGFDIKWLRTRAMAHGLSMRDTYNSIDTYKLVKKYLNLPSYSLANVCKYFGLEAKRDAGGVSTWDKIQFDKDKEALDTMLYYCDGDIISLEAVFKFLKPYVRNKTNHSVLKGGEKFLCPECGTHNVGISKTYTTAAGTIQHFMKCRDSDCSQHYKINNKTYMDLLQFRIRNSIK